MMRNNRSAGGAATAAARPPTLTPPLPPPRASAARTTTTTVCAAWLQQQQQQGQKGQQLNNVIGWRRRPTASLLTLRPPSASSSSSAPAPGDDDGGSAQPAAAAAAAAALTALLRQHFLPLALLAALVAGIAFPAVGVAAARLNALAVATFGIFVLQGLSLRRKEAATALSARGAIAWGLLSVLLLTPLLGKALVRLLPLDPPALAVGLGVFTCVPTALSSGVTFSQQVGANVPLALLLTVASNLAGVLTTPFHVPGAVAAAAAAAGGGGGAAGGLRLALEPLPLLLQLCQVILLPTLLGAAVRGFVPGAPQAIDARRRLASYASAALLALVPFCQISKAAAGGALAAVGPEALAAVVAAGLLVHGAFLALNVAACELLRLGGAEPRAARGVRRAVVLVASTKTLPVAVTVLGALAPALGERVVGLAVVPAVLAHLSQIIVDSCLASSWLAADSKEADKEREERERQSRQGGGGAS